MFLESFHEPVELLLSLSQTGVHLLNDLLLGVFAEPAARLQHLVDVLLLHRPHTARTSRQTTNVAQSL